jgi:hypothetical protein
MWLSVGIFAVPNNVWQLVAPLLERALIGQTRLRLREDQRKRRQADIRHRIDALARPLIGKSGAGILQSGKEAFKNQHPYLESESRFAGYKKIRRQTTI